MRLACALGLCVDDTGLCIGGGDGVWKISLKSSFGTIMAARAAANAASLSGNSKGFRFGWSITAVGGIRPVLVIS